MSRADDDIDDEGLEGLGSFRSMFREMPDEEPPQRGLAELMAAARVKAEEMAKPSLWERFLQTMRRPQVMALATIMILIGGAVFISQRKSEMDASPTATQSEYEALEKNAAQSAGSATTITQEAAKLEDTNEEAPADMLGADRGGQGAAAAAPAAVDSKRDEAKPRDDNFGAKGGGGGTATGAVEPQAAEPSRKATATPTSKAETKAPPKVSKPAPSKAPAKPRPSSAKSADSDLLLEGGFDDSPTAGAPPAAPPAPEPSPAPTADKPAAQPTTPSPSGAAGPTKQSTLSVQQLHTNARKLAASGDCAQVRTIAKQIAAKDAPYYRANIATDTSLAPCLK